MGGTKVRGGEEKAGEREEKKECNGRPYGLEQARRRACRREEHKARREGCIWRRPRGGERRSLIVNQQDQRRRSADLSRPTRERVEQSKDTYLSVHCQRCLAEQNQLLGLLAYANAGLVGLLKESRQMIIYVTANLAVCR